MVECVSLLHGKSLTVQAATALFFLLFFFFAFCYSNGVSVKWIFYQLLNELTYIHLHPTSVWTSSYRNRARVEKRKNNRKKNDKKITLFVVFLATDTLRYIYPYNLQCGFLFELFDDDFDGFIIMLNFVYTLNSQNASKKPFEPNINLTIYTKFYSNFFDLFVKANVFILLLLPAPQYI